MALFFAGICQGQTFWQGTSYGDTAEQVQAKVANAKPSQAERELLDKGITTMLTDKTTLVGHEFDVYFYFTKNGLDQVILRRTDLSSSAEAATTTNVLIQALRLKYGSATKRANAQAIIDRKPLWLMWESGDTDILLVPQHDAQVLTLLYVLSDESQERASAEKSKKYLRKINPKIEASKL